MAEVGRLTSLMAGGHFIRNNPCSLGGMRKLNSLDVHRTYISLIALALLAVSGVTGASAQSPKTSAAPHRETGAARASAHESSQQMLAMQVALDRAGFSAGEIDGQGGAKTRQALEAYQKNSGAPPDTSGDPLTTYTITEQDAAGPFIDTLPADMMAQAKLPALGYTGVLEALAEKFHSSPNLLKRLNPDASWKAGDVIKVPNVEPFDLSSAKAAPGTP